MFDSLFQIFDALSALPDFGSVVLTSALESQKQHSLPIAVVEIDEYGDELATDDGEAISEAIKIPILLFVAIGADKRAALQSLGDLCATVRTTIKQLFPYSRVQFSEFSILPGTENGVDVFGASFIATVEIQ